MEEPSHDPQHPTLISSPRSSISKTILATIILLALVCIVGAVGFYLGSINFFPKLELNNTATTTNEVTVIKEGWKIYRNEELGIKFNYPERLRVEDNQYKGDINVKLVDTQAVETGTMGPDDCGAGGDYKRTSYGLDMGILVFPNNPTYLKSFNSITWPSSPKEETIGGKKVKSVVHVNEMCGGESKEILWIGPNGKLVSFYVENKPLPILLEEVIKSVEIISSPATEGWKTYRNEDLGFEFQYPVEYLRDEARRSNYMDCFLTTHDGDGPYFCIDVVTDPNNLNYGSNEKRMKEDKFLQKDSSIKMAGVDALLYSEISGWPHTEMLFRNKEITFFLIGNIPEKVVSSFTFTK